MCRFNPVKAVLSFRSFYFALPDNRMVVGAVCDTSIELELIVRRLGVCAVELCVARTCHGEGVFTII